MAIQPIYTTVGNYLVDKAVVPYIRAQPIYVRGYNLRPYTLANYWFDNVSINRYVQPASFITLSSGTTANLFQHAEGIYCANTHAYAVVCENSQGTILHVDENYTCVNVSAYGANTFVTADYSVGDVVYMSNNSPTIYSNTAMGRVVYWNATDGALALNISHGTMSNTSGNKIIFKVGSTKRANVTNFVIGDKFPIGSTIKSVANISKTFLANSYTHNHGVITTTLGAGTQIQLSGKSSANMVNSNIFICSGYGIGQYAKITAVNTASHIVTLNTAWVGHFGNSYYAIGQVSIDDIGIATGIFRIPEDQNAKFQAGSRLVTINDGISHTDNTASMRATGTYEVSGSGTSSDTNKTPVVSPTPPLSPGQGSTTTPPDPTSKGSISNGISNDPQASADPLVQTFFTPKPNTQKTDYGIFATSVNLFFQSKPTGNSTHFPMSVYIVKTVNGFPTTKTLATASVRWEDVNVTNGTTTFPNSANSSTYTKFTFPDPVYLAPGGEYGIVVYSESPDYQVWVSKYGDTLINSTRLVSESPYLGSLFKSQNASAWTPIQNEKLMFVLNKAQFSTQSSSLLFNIDTPAQNTFMDIALLHSSDLTFPVANINYGLMTTIANTGTQDTGFMSVDVNSPLSFGNDLINSSLSSNRRRLVQEGNANSVLVQVQLNTTDPDVSPFFHAERLSLMSALNLINAGGISNTDVSILTPGNHINAANIVVTFSAPTGDGGVQATANIIALTGNSVTAINIINPGAGYIISPTLTISEPSAPANATLQVYGEDGKFGGNSLTRYITRQITLANGFDAGDIQVFMNVIRPTGTDVNIYYKVLSGQDTDQLTNKNWKIMSKAFDIFSPDQNTPIALSFNTGTIITGSVGSVSYVENGVTYPIGGKFKTFQIKIVLTANDPTVSPSVQNFRAVAVPAG